jgi:ABC-type nitrate/sulfonate/bicarbonate transport system permease component
MRLPRALIGLLVPLCAMLLWAVAARREWVPPQILPAPDEVWSAFSDLWTSGDLQHDTAISLLRVIEGSAIGVTAGLMLGTGLGLSRGMEAYVRPLFSALAQIPALGWLPLMMLLVGIGEPLKVVIIAIATAACNCFAASCCPPRCRRYLSAYATASPTPGWHWSRWNCSHRPRGLVICWSGDGSCFSSMS